MTPSRAIAIGLAILAGIGLFVLPQYLIASPDPGAPARLASAAPSDAAPADRAAIENIVREYLLENPELLREMADRLKNKDDARAQADRAEVFENAQQEIYDSEHQIVLGNPKGDVTLVEFFDYNCGYCKQALADTDALLKADPNLRLVLKEFPVLTQGSVDAARVAIAVSLQAPDKYLDFHRKLLRSDGASGERAVEIARELDLDIERLSADLTDPRIEASLISVQQLAKRLGINGTPTYVIGSEVLPGAIGYENLKEAVASMRKCGQPMCS